MSRQHPHTKLINAAARETLRPLGLLQEGRSRTWLDDQAWWLGIVEFQPSNWTRGSYLNVGVNWLWNVKDWLSFDFGYRVDEPGKPRCSSSTRATTSSRRWRTSWRWSPPNG